MSDENMKNLFSKSMKKRKWAILTVSISGICGCIRLPFVSKGQRRQLH